MTAKHSTTPQVRPDGAAKRGPERTCVGCGQRDDVYRLVRMILGPEGAVAFDLAGHAYGRGAHVHPAPDCLQGAARKGLARAFKTKVHCAQQVLCSELVQASDRRVGGLLNSAARSGNAVLGRDPVVQALLRGSVDLVLVARDAWTASQEPAVQDAVARGRALAWGSRSVFGAHFGLGDVAVVGIRGASLAEAIAEACHIADGVRSCAEVR
ncbi:MAG: DUF448 domain-containing protein [Polyangiaceae bacterium]|nr:DUF448 domain-containing protein [Polyangiaceae bacterium]